MDAAHTLKRPVISVGLVLAIVLLPSLISPLFRRELYAVSPSLYWAFDFAKFVVLPAAAALYLARCHGIRPKHYGVRAIAEHESWGQFIGLTIFLALLLTLVYYVAFLIGWYALRPEPIAPFYKEINPTGVLRIPSTLYLALTAALAEEVYCRALPLLYLERRFPGRAPLKLYILSTATMFGLIHWGNGPHEVLATFAFGVAAAILYLRLRDLWPLIAAHTVIDVVAFA